MEIRTSGAKPGQQSWNDKWIDRNNELNLQSKEQISQVKGQTQIVVSNVKVKARDSSSNNNRLRRFNESVNLTRNEPKMTIQTTSLH